MKCIRICVLPRYFYLLVWVKILPL
jgi:Glycosyltransferase